MRRTHRLRTGRLAAAALTFALASPALAQTRAPDADEVLANVGFPVDAKQRVLAGEMVETTLASTTERDIGAALAFLVRKPPEAFVDDILRKKLLYTTDPFLLEDGEFSGEGSLASLDALKLGADELELYASAEAGGPLNLSREELAALKSHAGDGAALSEAVKRQLLGRYQAYRKGGLGGIAAYDRGGEATDGAADLRKATDTLKGLQAYGPDFFRLLHEYPKGAPPDLREVFRWSHYTAHGEPALVLVHGFTGTVGGVPIGVQRQYYVSRGYNVEQAVAGFFPVREGTLVVYANHTSTEQVSGFGGSAKRKIGRKLMASQLADLYQRIREAAEKS